MKQQIIDMIFSLDREISLLAVTIIQTQFPDLIIYSYYSQYYGGWTYERESNHVGVKYKVSDRIESLVENFNKEHTSLLKHIRKGELMNFIDCLYD